MQSAVAAVRPMSLHWKRTVPETEIGTGTGIADRSEIETASSADPATIAVQVAQLHGSAAPVGASTAPAPCASVPLSSALRDVPDCAAPGSDLPGVGPALPAC